MDKSRRLKHLGRFGGHLDGSARPKSAAAPQVSASRRPRCPSSVNVRAAPAGVGRLVPELSTTAAPVGQGREGPGNGPGRPARASKPSGEGHRPGERREGAGSPPGARRAGSAAWLDAQHDIAGSRGRRPGESPAAWPLKCQRVDLIVRSGDARSSAGGRHRRNWRWGPRCIVKGGDGRPWFGRGQPRRK